MFIAGMKRIRATKLERILQFTNVSHEQSFGKRAGFLFRTKKFPAPEMSVVRRGSEFTSANFFGQNATVIPGIATG
jgi:hypothetical protein